MKTYDVKLTFSASHTFELAAKSKKDAEIAAKELADSFSLFSNAENTTHDVYVDFELINN